MRRAQAAAEHAQRPGIDRGGPGRWPEFLVKRRWNGWAAWLRDDTTGQPAAVAKTPWRLAAEIRKVYIGPRR